MIEYSDEVYVLFEHAVRWYRFDCTEFIVLYHVTMNSRNYGTMRMCQMLLSFVAPK